MTDISSGHFSEALQTSVSLKFAVGESLARYTSIWQVAFTCCTSVPGGILIASHTHKFEGTIALPWRHLGTINKITGNRTGPGVPGLEHKALTYPIMHHARKRFK